MYHTGRYLIVVQVRAILNLPGCVLMFTFHPLSLFLYLHSAHGTYHRRACTAPQRTEGNFEASRAMLRKAAALLTAMCTWNTKSPQPPYPAYIAPFSTQSAHTPPHKYCIYALNWCLLLYGNDTGTVQSLFHPLKGEPNRPRVLRV